MDYNKNDNKQKINNRNYNINKNRQQDRDSIYEAKRYPKKTKKHNTLFDIYVPEYELEKQRVRHKRESDYSRSQKNRFRYD